MDLLSVESYVRLTDLSDLNHWQSDWAWLAGGTWLFSEPQPQIRTLIDLNGLNWSELLITSAGLSIGATCVMDRLLKVSFPQSWSSIKALQAAVHALASFKIQGVATVGGNLCLALPAGTFAPVMLVLEADYQLLSLDGSCRWVKACDFQTGDRKTVLKPGEVLRQIRVPITHLHYQVDYQRLCVAAAGVAMATVVTAYDPLTSHVRFGISGSLAKPELIEVEGLPTASDIGDLLDTVIPIEAYLNDFTAGSKYRRHLTEVLMTRGLNQIRIEPHYGI